MRLALPLAPLLLPALLGGGCSPRPAAEGLPGPARDSVLVAVPDTLPPDRVADASLRLQGPARYASLTVGEAALLRAERVEQRLAAEEAIASGMYLGDPVRVLRLEAAPGREAVAAVPLRLAVGTPFVAELLVRLEGEAPAPTLRFEHLPDVPPPDDPRVRRAPAAVGFELLPAPDGAGYDRARLLLGDGRAWSEQPEVSIPARDWRRLAHRIGVAVETDRVSLVLDGGAVVEAEVYLSGPLGTPRLRATAPDGPAAPVLVFQWTADVDGVE